MTKKKPSYFWASYADLMTSLFFIMLTLFVLTILVMHNNAKVVKEELDFIKQMYAAHEKIDSTYFAYNAEHKKHVMKIDVAFETGKADIKNIGSNKLKALEDAGKAIQKFISTSSVDSDIYEVRYLLVIEGQASKDNYHIDNFMNNDVLSYQRALALKKYWETNSINFPADKCELLVSGSGQDGQMRIIPDNKQNTANQRFLIHIIPKPDLLQKNNKKR